VNEPVELPDRQDGVPARDRMGVRVWQNRDICGYSVIVEGLQHFSDHNSVYPRRARLITLPSATTFCTTVGLNVVERI
jgi:hypothetical protein